MTNLILGIDEVGRGSLAGPLYVGACVLPSRDSTNEKSWQSQLTDSKLLTKTRRKLLAQEINQRAVSTGLGSVEPAEIDKYSLSAALKTATRLAVANAIKNSLPNPPAFSARGYSSRRDFSLALLTSFASTLLPFDEIIIDGPQNFLQGTFLEKLVTNLNKADLLIKEVSAASIIAKVSRDHLMTEYATQYPAYAFDRNAGYGTKAHLEALNHFGPCPLHRFSYNPVKKAFLQSGIDPAYLDSSTFQNFPNYLTSPQPSTSHPSTTSVGNRAESIVIKYLEKSGHKILARNLKTHDYEIDIISKSDGRIYFTEVKYRKSGNPLDAITAKKCQKMALATQSVMSYLSATLNRPLESLPTPVLAVASVSGSKFHLDDWFALQNP